MSDTVDLDHLAGHVETLRQVKAKQAELAEVREQLEQTVKDALGEAITGTVDGVTAVTWKRLKRTALSQALLARLYPDVAAECQETTEYRRFEVRE